MSVTVQKLNWTQLAELTGLSRQWLHELRDQGVIAPKGGKFDMAITNRAIIGFYRDQRAGDQREKLLKVQTERQQLKLDQERGMLMRVDDAEAAHAKLTLANKARVMAIPPRVDQRFSMETDPAKIREILTLELNDAYKETADGND